MGDDRGAGSSAAAAGRSSAHEWCWAITSVSGPIVNRPASSAIIGAAHSGGATRARRYSASVAAGHSCRPGGHGGAAPVAGQPQAGPVPSAVRSSTRRTRPSRSARWISASRRFVAAHTSGQG